MRQPWAWAIVHGGKFCENRRQPWSYRGPLAIHAAAAMAVQQFRASEFVEQHATADPPWGHNPRGDAARDVLPVGVVIGVVDLVDVHPAAPGGCCAPWGEWTPDTCHLVLENPRPIDPLPAKGRLGLWHDVDVLAEVRRRLGAAA